MTYLIHAGCEDFEKWATFVQLSCNIYVLLTAVRAIPYIECGISLTIVNSTVITCNGWWPARVHTYCTCTSSDVPVPAGQYRVALVLREGGTATYGLLMVLTCGMNTITWHVVMLECYTHRPHPTHPHPPPAPIFTRNVCPQQITAVTVASTSFTFDPFLPHHTRMYLQAATHSPNEWTVRISQGEIIWYYYKIQK